MNTEIYPSDIFSVEQIPGVNGLAAFITDSRQVFREEADCVEGLAPDGTPYIKWGRDDTMPYKVIDLIESDETLSTCQIWNAEMCYGHGLSYNTSQCQRSTAEEISEFFFNNNITEYFLGVCQDIKHFSFAVSVITLSRGADRIASVTRREACYCRFAPADETGKIPYILYGNFRRHTSIPDQQFEKIPLLDPAAPWLDLLKHMATPNPQAKFAVIARFSGPDSLYYPIPPYASIFRGSWYNIKKLIGIAKESKLKNAAPIKYIISVSPKYWEEVFSELRIIDPKEKAKVIKERKQQMMRFLTTTENTGSILFTSRQESIDGRAENPLISVTSIDSRTKEGGDWESDIAEAINMICFTMHVHSNLVGSVPGKAQTNNSGSDKRELYTIAQALQKPYRDILFKVHEIIIRFNGWEGAFPECPFIQLTTLDEHKDAKEVSI